MPSKKRLTLVLPEGLGLVSKFAKTPRRFVRVKNGSLADGDILLQLTLQELRLIRRISKDMNMPYPEHFQDAKAQYDELLEELDRLAEDLYSTPWYNLIRRREIRDDTHTLVESGYELLVATKSTSEKMQRSELSLVQEVEDEDIAPDEPVKGVAIDPFADPIAPDLAFDQATLQNIYNVFIGCVNADNSDASEITVNNAGSSSDSSSSLLPPF